MTSPSPTAPYLSLCHPISSYADGPGPVTEKRSSAAAAPPWPGALSRAWSGSVLSPQPGLVRFGPLSPVLWILSPQPGPVRCPQPTSVPSARFSPPPWPGPVPSIRFCLLGPVLSSRPGSVTSAWPPRPGSVSSAPFCLHNPLPSAQPGSVRSARFSLSLSLSLQAGPGSFSPVLSLWPGSLGPVPSAQHVGPCSRRAAIPRRAFLGYRREPPAAAGRNPPTRHRQPGPPGTTTPPPQKRGTAGTPKPRVWAQRDGERSGGGGGEGEGREGGWGAGGVC